MMMTESNFRAVYDEPTSTVVFSGTLRMNELAEFARVRKFLREAYDVDSPYLIIDFRDLEFMNSAGISTLCKFIFEIKDLTPVKSVTVVGNRNILWQEKSFENLKKIWDRLSIRLE